MSLPPRACNSPAPGPGGNSCEGGDREEVECGTEQCGEYQGRKESGQCQKFLSAPVNYSMCAKNSYALDLT